MESENRMRGEERHGGRRGKKEGARRTERAREIKRAMLGGREGEMEREMGCGGMEQGGSGLKMMIHPDPSECCHVPPSR